MQDEWKPPQIKRNINGGRGVGGGGQLSRKRTYISWMQIPPEAISQYVQEMSDEFYSVTLSRTSDGGALSITLLMGDDKVQYWPHTVEDCLRFFCWCSANLTSSESNVTLNRSTNLSGSKQSTK